MSFRRLSVPAYYNGLPAGYGYINNALTGTPADYDVARASGPNAGTFFVGFGEDGRGRAVNRGLKQLSENTDVLDNLVRRDFGAPKVLLATAAGAVSSINLTGPLWAGAGGTPNTVEGIRTFVALVDVNDNEILSGTAECQVTAITGATPGDGWTGNITLTVSPPIPDTVVYKVFFYQRSAVALVDEDTWSRARRYNVYSGGAAWADGTTNPVTTVTGQLSKILRELAGNTGSAKIGTPAHAAAFTGSSYALAGADISAQLAELLDLVSRRSRSIAGAVTLDDGGFFDSTILMTASGYNIQLPDPSTRKGRTYWLLDATGALSNASAVTLVRFGTENVNNLAGDYPLDTTYGRWMLHCDGANWHTAFLPA